MKPSKGSTIAQLRALRDARAKAAIEGNPAPVAFWWDDPELLTAENNGVFEIHFNDMIDDWYGISSSMIVQALMNAGGKDVLVHLNSPGGMVFEGMSIHAAFAAYTGNVTMRVEGLAASAASFVMLAGDTVEVTETGTVMIHDAWDMTIGPESEHRKAADVLAKISNSIAGMYAEKSGGALEDWRATMIAEEWYVGQEAVDAGLVDSIFTPASGDTDAAAASAAANARWSGIFARRRLDQPVDVSGVEQQPGTETLTLPWLDSARSLAPNDDTAPAWWSVLHSGMKRGA